MYEFEYQDKWLEIGSGVWVAWLIECLVGRWVEEIFLSWPKSNSKPNKDFDSLLVLALPRKNSALYHFNRRPCWNNNRSQARFDTVNTAWYSEHKTCCCAHRSIRQVMNDYELVISASAAYDDDYCCSWVLFNFRQREPKSKLTLLQN